MSGVWRSFCGPVTNRSFRAFSSEVASGSREENALKAKT
jgi:hypothetical protein